MATAQKLNVYYVGDASGLRRTIQEIESMHRGLGERLRSIGARISQVGRTVTAGVTLPIVGFGVAAVKAFTDAQRVSAQTEAVLRSTGGVAGVTARDVGKLAQEIMNYSGISDETVQSAENLLLTFTNIRNEAGRGNDIFTQATRIAADMSVALGQDMKSSAMQLGKALNDPVRGITALRRVGVSFTDQQVRMIQEMVEAGDVLGAQKVILAELTKEFGGSAKAAGKTVAGQFQIMKERIGNVMEGIGRVIVQVGMPVFEQLGRAVEAVGKWFRGLSPEAKRLGVVIAAAAAAAGPLLIVLGGIVSAIGTLLSPIGLVVVAIGGLVAAFVYAWRNSQTFREIVTGAFQAVREAVAAVLPLVAEEVRSFVGAVKAFWSEFGDDILRVTRSAWNLIKGVVAGALKAIRGVIDIVMGLIHGDWSQVWKGIKEFLGGIWNGIKSLVRDGVGLLKELVRTGIHGVREIWEGIWNRIKEIFSGIWGKIKQIAADSINWVIDRINGLIDKLNWLSDKLDWLAGPGLNWGNIPHIPHVGEAAEGGIVRRSGLTLVGERGPELLQLPRGSVIAPLPAVSPRVEIRDLRVQVLIDRRRFTEQQKIAYVWER
jgi:phage-related protein